MTKTGRRAKLEAERKSLAPYARNGEFQFVAPPAGSFIERERRLGSGHRDLTGELMGDPRIGYSALDRERA